MIRTFLKKINLAVLCLFYFGAGCNHFLHPVNYLAMIPPYLPLKEVINYVCGILEIICSLLMLFSSTRKFAMYLTIFLLIAFIPAHIYLIQLGGCVSHDFCFPAWVAWVRLFPFQFVLMWWAYKTWTLSMDIRK